MFSFLYSERKKLRVSAESWLEMAVRVHKFRRDLLSEPQNHELLAAATEVRLRLKERAEPDRLKPAIASLEKVLRETGGRIYPVHSMIENVEFFLGAAIVILGLRAYFIQPFKIPTNSMWPSYYGMTHDTFLPGEEPGLLRKAVRLVTLGTSNYTLKAPADGEVLVPITREGQLVVSEKPGRSMWVFPTTIREYTFMIDGQMAKIDVPADFDRDHEVMKETFFGRDAGSFYGDLRSALQKAGPLETSTLTVQAGARRGDVRVAWVPLGRKVRRGDTLLSFDILTGDMLFVDRLTYNFVRPKIGSGFVFKTDNIEGMKEDKGAKYLVKRLVGVPGDRLEIKAPRLYRNGQPIEGSTAFGKNARREGTYPGYTHNGSLGIGDTVNVPNHVFYALGDNSPRSNDSRYWGFVPEKDVVGQPMFIYYPLTSRWGPAK